MFSMASGLWENLQILSVHSEFLFKPIYVLIWLKYFHFWFYWDIKSASLSKMHIMNKISKRKKNSLFYFGEIVSSFFFVQKCKSIALWNWRKNKVFPFDTAKMHSNFKINQLFLQILNMNDDNAFYFISKNSVFKCDELTDRKYHIILFMLSSEGNILCACF